MLLSAPTFWGLWSQPWTEARILFDLCQPYEPMGYLGTVCQQGSSSLLFSLIPIPGSPSLSSEPLHQPLMSLWFSHHRWASWFSSRTDITSWAFTLLAALATQIALARLSLTHLEGTHNRVMTNFGLFGVAGECLLLDKCFTFKYLEGEVAENLTVPELWWQSILWRLMIQNGRLTMSLKEIESRKRGEYMCVYIFACAYVCAYMYTHSL